MNNEETKKKMVKVLQELRASKPIVPNDYGLQIISCTTDREIADALIAAGIGDVKEIKYRVRRAEKALYIACRETAEIIFKDDFDRHAQEYMYGYLIQAEKELAEEEKE